MHEGACFLSNRTGPVPGSFKMVMPIIFQSSQWLKNHGHYYYPKKSRMRRWKIRPTADLLCGGIKHFWNEIVAQGGVHMYDRAFFLNNKLHYCVCSVFLFLCRFLCMQGVRLWLSLTTCRRFSRITRSKWQKRGWKKTFSLMRWTVRFKFFKRK